ncbi:E3 ubiquitin-protein ligase TRIM21 isoform X2 [Procambarus clarkii]|nr:E3 ubiquitin-protein ligase TRIM21-like isoform X2 [Procambarus clarkii]XP_045581218.1 E3 ubiquitin-protein ligase TRIM21-like isoform X2 [Procambarus clarkii]
MADKKDDPGDCKVCFMRFDTEVRRPRMLVSCGHSFCSICITNMIKDNSTILCPSCRTEQALTEAEQLPINFALLELVDSDNSSSESVVTDQHLRTSIDPLIRAPVLNAGHCEDHGQYKLFQCTTCAEYICHVCTVVDHPSSTCTVISIKKSVDDSKMLHTNSISTDINKCKEVTDHLENYDAYLETWIKDHEDHISQLKAEVQLHKDMMQKLRDERERIKRTLDEGLQKMESLEAEQTNLGASFTLQEVSDAVCDALHVQTDTRNWNLQCTEQFPETSLVSSSLKMHTVTAFALDMMRNYDQENSTEAQDRTDRDQDITTTGQERTINSQEPSASIKEKLIALMQTKGLSEATPGDNNPSANVSGAEAPEAGVGSLGGGTPHPPLTRAPPFTHLHAYCSGGHSDYPTQLAKWASYYRSYGMHREAEIMEQQARSIMDHLKGTGPPAPAPGVMAAAAVVPVTCPPLTQPCNYSQEWIDYYHLHGMHEEAHLLEQQMQTLKRDGSNPGTFAPQPPYYGGY